MFFLIPTANKKQEKRVLIRQPTLPCSVFPAFSVQDENTTSCHCCTIGVYLLIHSIFGQIESQLKLYKSVCVRVCERKRENIIFPAVIFCLVFAFEKASLKHAKIEFQSFYLVEHSFTFTCAL